MKKPSLNPHDRRAWARFTGQQQYAAQTADYGDYQTMRGCNNRRCEYQTQRGRAFIGLRPGEIAE